MGRGFGFKVFDRKGKPVLFDDEGGRDKVAHVHNLLDCVRSRKPPTADIEIGYLSALHCHLGNIAARVGRAIKFDAKTETIPGDPEANRLPLFLCLLEVCGNYLVGRGEACLSRRRSRIRFISFGRPTVEFKKTSSYRLLYLGILICVDLNRGL